LITAYRLCSSRFSPNSGTGAALYGGRWNPIGVEVVYAAEHYTEVPEDYVLSAITIPDTVKIEIVPKRFLPKGWDAITGSRAGKAFGRKWVKESRSAVLSVPSSIVQSERVLILNPAHPDFPEIQFGKPVPHPFDPRLK
jgi:RES domain-containing protein